MKYLLLLLICLFTIQISAQTTTVSLETGIVFKSGEVAPVARTEFYLLSQSLETTLVTSEFRELMLADIRANKVEYLTDRVKAAKFKDFVSALTYPVIYPSYAESALKSFKETVKFQTTTDFQGKAFFNVPPGKYYLFGVSNIRKNTFVWHIEIEVKKEPLNIILDQNNTL